MTSGPRVLLDPLCLLPHIYYSFQGGNSENAATEKMVEPHQGQAGGNVATFVVVQEGKQTPAAAGAPASAALEITSSLTGAANAAADVTDAHVSAITLSPVGTPISATESSPYRSLKVVDSDSAANSAATSTTAFAATSDADATSIALYERDVTESASAANAAALSTQKVS